jgi:two-component system, LytTR family, sensor histidine kinase AlgZ
MHPILTDRRRLALYLIAWSVLATSIALLALEPGELRVSTAALRTIPPTFVFAFLCLAAWYPVRALPLRRARIAGVLAAHLVAALVIGGLWLLLMRSWGAVLAEFLETVPASAEPTAFFAMGVLLYLLSVAVHYLLVEFEQARQIEKRELEVTILARDAELKLLKAQLDPHFLFNSLNSISSLCGSSPSSARTLTTLLADYLRKSLRVGVAESITLSEELELLSSYIAIERIRFGPRLELEQDIDESVRQCRVPPLFLQPLVENAVTHGIAQLVEGGTVVVTARRDGEGIRLSVENPCDPDRPRRTGAGTGLANARRRAELFYDHRARMDIVDEETRHRVSLLVPAETC